jgi:predicted nucleotide-binding protein (sugar kinase/HSP70/actin superfamily)
MLQYALNDAKSVIYIFLIFLGLYFYLTQDFLYENEESINEFYENIQNKFYENIENKNLKKLDTNEMNLIFIEISMRCHELVKYKLKENYLRLNIRLNC